MGSGWGQNRHWPGINTAFPLSQSTSQVLPLHPFSHRWPMELDAFPPQMDVEEGLSCSIKEGQLSKHTDRDNETPSVLEEESRSPQGPQLRSQDPKAWDNTPIPLGIDLPARFSGPQRPIKQSSHWEQDIPWLCPADTVDWQPHCPAPTSSRSPPKGLHRVRTSSRIPLLLPAGPRPIVTPKLISQ